MTARSRWLAVVAALAASLAAVPIAEAKTRITSNGNVVTITVPIDIQLVGHDPVTDADRAYFDQLKTLTDRYWWGDKLRKLKYDDCLTFELVLDFNLLPDNPDAAPRLDEAHQIEWWLDDPNVRSTVIDHGTSDANADAPTAFREPLAGTWGSMNIRDFNHELGHLLGLGDDYSGYPDSKPLPGREGTMMDTGSGVDQTLVDRIGKMIEEAGLELPDCGEVWQGTWHGEHGTPGIVSRDDGEYRLTVAPNGAVRGKGAGTQVTEGGSGRYSLTIAGRRDDDAFRLEWTGPGGSIDVIAPIRGETAAGTWRVGSATVFYRGRTTLRCLNCEKQDGG